MSGALRQLPSEVLARQHIPTADCPVVPSPGSQLPSPVFPNVGSFWRGRDGLAVVEAVSDDDVIDYSWRGVTLSLPLRDFLADFPTEVRI